MTSILTLDESLRTALEMEFETYGKKLIGFQNSITLYPRIKVDRKSWTIIVLLN